MLSSFASIAPDHTQWSQILETLDSPSHKYSIDKYTSSSYHQVTNIPLTNTHPAHTTHENNGKLFKKDLKKTVTILAECLEGERDRKKPHQSGVWVMQIFQFAINLISVVVHEFQLSNWPAQKFNVDSDGQHG